MMIHKSLCSHCGGNYILTPRQVEIVKELAAHPGYSITRLALHLCISPHTLRNHLRQIYKSLQVSNKLQCISTCLELNIIGPDDFPKRVH